MDIKREHHINFWYVILAFIAILFIQDLLVQSAGVKTIPYSEFQTLLQQQQLTTSLLDRRPSRGNTKLRQTRARHGFPRSGSMLRCCRS